MTTKPRVARRAVAIAARLDHLRDEPLVVSTALRARVRRQLDHLEANRSERDPLPPAHVSTLKPQQLRRLQKALDAEATAKSRAFWSRYLKGDARFRGVPMAGVRQVVHRWWRTEGLEAWSARAQIDVALRLFEEEHTEDKLAGVLALSEILLPSLSKRNLPALARLFARGHIADWNLCDWFCVKVLGKMIAQADDPLDLAEAISSWRTAESLWQRRAACVAFVDHAKHGDERIPGLSRLVLKNAEALVRDRERFAQTGVGWVLRELSLADREAVVAFAEAQAANLSREGMKSIVEKMPAADKKRLLALHREASPRGTGTKRP